MGVKRPPSRRNRRSDSSIRPRVSQKIQEIAAHDALDVLGRIASLPQQRGQRLKIGNRLQVLRALLAAVSAILHFIRKGKVVSVSAVGEAEDEALEVIALETSELVGKPLREAKFKDAIVGAIVRGDRVIIAGGNDVIEVGDHVVIFALKSAIARLERQMTVQLRYF